MLQYVSGFGSIVNAGIGLTQDRAVPRLPYNFFCDHRMKHATNGSQGTKNLETKKILGGLLGAGCGLAILLLVIICVSRKYCYHRNHHNEDIDIQRKRAHKRVSMLHFSSRPLPSEPRPAPKTPDHDPYRRNPLVHEAPYPAKLDRTIT